MIAVFAGELMRRAGEVGMDLVVAGMVDREGVDRDFAGAGMVDLAVAGIVDLAEEAIVGLATAGMVDLGEDRVGEIIDALTPTGSAGTAGTTPADAVNVERRGEGRLGIGDGCCLAGAEGDLAGADPVEWRPPSEGRVALGDCLYASSVGDLTDSTDDLEESEASVGDFKIDPFRSLEK